MIHNFYKWIGCLSFLQKKFKLTLRWNGKSYELNIAKKNCQSQVCGQFGRVMSPVMSQLNSQTQHPPQSPCIYRENNDKNKNKSSIWAFFLSNSSCLFMSINYTSLLIFSCPRSSVPSLLIDSRSIVQSDRCGNQKTSKFLTQASWRLYEIRQPQPCVQPPTSLKIWWST